MAYEANRVGYCDGADDQFGDRPAGGGVDSGELVDSADAFEFADVETVEGDQVAGPGGEVAEPGRFGFDHGLGDETRQRGDRRWSYIRSHAFTRLLDNLDIDHILIKPHCPWQNGKVECFNRTFQTEWAYR